MSYWLDIINVSRLSVCVGYVVDMPRLLNGSIPVDIGTSLGKCLVISIISGSLGIG
jgi:hypothetical protein